MDSEQSPTSSTPVLSKSKMTKSNQDFPAPLMESPMEMVTSSEETVMEAKEPECTPLARRTRSHDGNDKKCFLKDDPDELLNSIMAHVNKEIKEEVEKRKEAEEIANKGAEAMSE